MHYNFGVIVSRLKGGYESYYGACDVEYQSNFQKWQNWEKFLAAFSKLIRELGRKKSW